MHLARANTHKQTPDTGVATVCIITPAAPLPSHSMGDKSITRWREEAGETHTQLRERERGRQVDISQCQDIQDSASARHHDYDNS